MLHVVDKAPVGLHLGVKDEKEPADKVIHSLRVADLWVERCVSHKDIPQYPQVRVRAPKIKYRYRLEVNIKTTMTSS